MKQKIKITREQISEALYISRNAKPLNIIYQFVDDSSADKFIMDFPSSIEVEVDVPEPKVVNEWISPTGFAVTEDSMKEVVGLFKESSKLDALEKRVVELERKAPFVFLKKDMVSHVPILDPNSVKHQSGTGDK